jgi:hypothetical protein
MKSRSRDLALSLSLAVAALIVRWPLRSRYLYHWDSVNFALSLEWYDVRLHQPQPPGYVLYSMLGALVNLAARDANASLVWISLLSGALGVAAIYWLGARMFGQGVGVAAALLALTNPLHWFYSEIALSYALEFLLVTIVAGLCYLQLTGNRRIWPWLALALGLAGGVRQNDLIFLLPLWLLSLWPLSWIKRAASALIVGLAAAAWLWPMMMLSGGPAGYLAALNAAGDGIAHESSFFSARDLGLNVARMAVYLGYGVLIGVFPLAWGAWALARAAHERLADRRAWVLAMWIAPAFGFYIFVHLRQHGHIFTFLPAVLLLEALAIRELGRSLAALVQARRAAGALAALLVACNAGFFLLAPRAPFGSERLPLLTPSRATIAERDRFLGERISAIRRSFDPRASVVLADGFDFRHPDFYLRDFQNPALSYELGTQTTRLPDEVRTLILFDDITLPQPWPDRPWQHIATPSAGNIRYITWGSGQYAMLSQSAIDIEQRQ